MTYHPWQKKQWDFLVQQYQQQRLPHALLLFGPEGLGQFEFARSFAHYILCQSHQACGICRDCQLIAAQSHPDFLMLTPEEKGKAIKVDELRELIASLNSTSQRGGYQVVIIYPAEQMNYAAANAFLKTLEEPAGKVLLLLVAHQLANIPATILSRCQRIRFQETADQNTLHWLKSQLKTSTDPQLLLNLAEGAPLRALEFEKNNFLQLRNTVLKDLLRIIDQEIYPLELTAEYVDFEIHLLLTAYLLITSDLIKIQQRFPLESIRNLDCAAQLNVLAKKISCQNLLTFQEKIINAQKLLNTNANVQLLVENLLLNLLDCKSC